MREKKRAEKRQRNVLRQKTLRMKRKRKRKKIVVLKLWNAEQTLVFE